MRPSFQQEGLWAQAQVLDHPEALNMPSALRLLGAFDYRRLVSALERVVARHDALRSTFRLIDGRLQVVVQDAARIDSALIDMTGESLDRCREQATRDVDKPIDLAHGPLVRLRVYRLRDDDVVLVLTIHHAAVDAASMAIIWTDLVGELSAGARGPVSPCAASYVGFAEAQRRRVSNEALAELVAVRAQQLEGVASYRDVWSADPGPREQHPSLVRQRVVAPEIAQGVSRTAAQLFVSDFMLLLVIFRVAMWRTTGVSDGAVEIPVSGRSEPGTEETVGYFLDLHAIRNGIDPDEALSHAVERECDGVLTALETPELASWRLHQFIDRTPGRSRSRVSDVTFSLRPQDEFAPRIDGCLVQPFSLNTGYPVFTLAFDVQSLSDGSLAIVAHGDASVIRPGRIDELLDSFCAGLRDVAAGPNIRLGTIGTVSGGSRPRDDTKTSTVVLLKDGTGPSVFLLPALTGSPAVYIDLVKNLPESLRVWGLSIAGPIVAEADTLADLAVACAEAIRRVQPTGPYALTGWSLGGALAHAVASALDGNVSHLVMIDTTTWVDDDSPRSSAECALEQLSGVALADSEISSLATAQLTLLRTHRPHVLPVPVTFIAAVDTDSTAPSWPYTMWGPYVGELDVQAVEAAHDSMLSSPVVKTLAKMIAQVILGGAG